jgi:hypothetical protein
LGITLVEARMAMQRYERPEEKEREDPGLWLRREAQQPLGEASV